jgi:LytS/YehU family sensor histidine kinase
MALISIDQEKSRDAILLLSDLLRFTLNYGKEREIRLSEEITETKKYLELEQIRFGSKLKVLYDIDENTLNSLVPPASVLTLAENAIKHGRAAADGLTTIVIAAGLNEQMVEIKVKNTGKLSNKQDAKGLGVPIVKKRIEAIYGAEGRFFIQSDGAFVEAVIQIPAR